VVEVVQLHRDHTPRWPTKFTPAAPAILHHVRGRYPRKLTGLRDQLGKN